VAFQDIATTNLVVLIFSWRIIPAHIGIAKQAILLEFFAVI